MAARLRRSTTERRVRAEEEARLERTRSLEARGALNARKGFVHALCVGEVDGASVRNMAPSTRGAARLRPCESAGRVRLSRWSGRALTYVGSGWWWIQGVTPRPVVREYGAWFFSFSGSTRAAEGSPIFGPADMGVQS